MFSIIELPENKKELNWHQLRVLVKAVNKSKRETPIPWNLSKDETWERLNGCEIYEHYLSVDKDPEKILRRYVRQATCTETVQYSFESCKKDLELYMNDPEIYENGNEDIGPFHEYGLEFGYTALGTWEDQTEDYYEYLLSWGGPSEMFRFYENGRIEYRYHNWFDGAGIDVTGNDVAEWVKDWFEGCDSINFEREREESNYHELILELEQECEICETPDTKLIGIEDANGLLWNVCRDSDCIQQASQM